MKKLLLLSAAIAMSAGSFAQASFGNEGQSFTGSQSSRSSVVSSKIDMQTNVSAKSSGYSDTLYDFLPTVFSLQIFDTGAYYILGSLPADSGAFFGPNTSGFSAFAEWFNPGTYFPDTTVEILGCVTRWGGTVQSGSTKTISYKMWPVDMLTETPVDSDIFLIEMPGATATYSQTANITSLYMDTALTFAWFPAQPVTGPFYLGYEPNFPFAPAGGDTIGLYSSRNGYSWFHGAFDTVQNVGNDIDTLYYAQTVYKVNNVWHDVWVDNVASVNLSILPVYRFEGGNVFPASVKGIKANNITVFGNYPNPAVNNTNIRFALTKAAQVEVTIYDMTGRTLSTKNYGQFASGENTVSVETSNFASGNYVYIISTSNGSALAAQFTVAK